MMNILNKVSGFADKGIPHAWNDLDALEVGNGGMDDEEYKTHCECLLSWKLILSFFVD